MVPIEMSVAHSFRPLCMHTKAYLASFRRSTLLSKTDVLTDRRRSCSKSKRNVRVSPNNGASRIGGEMA